MAKKKIPNMTRAEHKRKLEQAVFLQNAAMRQIREKTSLPNTNHGDIYEQVVEAGHNLLREENNNARYNIIKSYYSRSDVQSAMYSYAKGRKISVLKNFRPMFSGSTLRKAEDILPIMMFYSREWSLWPSMHGTVSRYDEDGNSLCDLVVEVDCKKSRVRCFNLTRPLIRLFRDLELEFRVKYSGNASPHVIIPGEVFPEKWRRGGNCRHLYAKLLDFFREQIKEPRLLDGSFRNSSHFLRLAYSLNENTGLVSVPIEIDNYDRFSWQSASPESVVVLEDWWDIPDDAQERTESLIEFVFGEKQIFAATANNVIQTELTHLRPDIIGKNTQIGMIKAGEEIIERFTDLSSSMDPSLSQNIINELHNNIEKSNIDQRQITKTHVFKHLIKFAQKHGISKSDLILLWNWSNKSELLKYYARRDVQEFIYSYSQDRCISIGNSGEYMVLEEPSAIFPLVAYQISEGIMPAFQCTNAKYDHEDGKMVACDLVLNSIPIDIDVSVFDMPCFALYNGDTNVKIVIPFESFNVEHSPSQISALKSDLSRNIKGRLKKGRISISIYESSTPIPYTIADDAKNIYLPVKLDGLVYLMPSMANISAVDKIIDMNSLITTYTKNGNE